MNVPDKSDRASAIDWRAWHDEYDDPDSRLSRRLRDVQTQIRAALDICPPGPVRVVSLCAGQGRDLLEVLADHPRRHDVKARLLESDERNIAFAEEMARAKGLHGVEVVNADASLIDNCRGIVPADLVLLCGVFGNIVDDDIERTINACSQLCRTGGAVIWTRHRDPPDRVPLICQWFEARGFDRCWLSGPAVDYGVGAHRYTREPQPLVMGLRMFAFLGSDVLGHRKSHPQKTS